TKRVRAAPIPAKGAKNPALTGCGCRCSSWALLFITLVEPGIAEQEKAELAGSVRHAGRRREAICVALFISVACASACVGANDQALRRPDDGDAGPTGITVDGGGGGQSTPPDAEPHALLGVEPSHGPYSGGSLALIRGNGFASSARVWFGETEVSPEAVVAIDAERLQVVVPPGPAGSVDVQVQNGDDTSTHASLIAGYFYDALYADPAEGPTAGGTLIRLRGQNTGWTKDTEVEVDLIPCPVEEFVGPEELTCRTPSGTPGAKLLRTTTGDAVLDVLDGFTYVNSDNGYRGGLSGDPLAGDLTVLAFDDASGEAIPGATVIVGDEASTALTGSTDADGVSVVSDPALIGSATVTVAKHCFQPITFLAVPSSRLTVFLQPVLAADCGSGGSLPGGSGTSGHGASISGELVWEATGEFRRTGWTNVPPLKTDSEQYVAYVFRLSSNPTNTFSLPSAINAVTPSSEGTAGYSFYLSTVPGNYTLYALAGIEDDSKSPRTFTAYAIGLVQGVAVEASDTRDDVFINIDVPLDHALTLEVAGPTPTVRGPDRLEATVAIGIGSQGYVLLPNGKQSRLLPLSGDIDFVGVPPLVGSLAGSRYVTTARAVTGEAGGTPLSVVGLLTTTVTSEPIGADAFVEIPKLESPALNSTWNGTDLALGFTAGGAPVDLTLVDIASGGGLINWRIVAPGAAAALKVPDLRAFPDELGLSPGSIAVLLTAARIDDFSYGALRYRDLGDRGWRAYASDLYYATY
ncbi:MAG TPA: IPT/TIG domain-containing protein, partial [Polyangiaceae bacterium]|nr:IPT/TIG domain-containing protein [Polyangiaceae bacterium]